MTKLSLSKAEYKYEELYEKYHQFLGPSFEIIIDGTNILQAGVAVLNVEVNTSVLHSADSFEFTVGNAFNMAKKDFDWLDDFLTVGKYIEITMGYNDKNISVFYGLITSVQPHFPVGESPIVFVSGMDISFLMMRGKTSNSWNDKKHSEIVMEIGKRYLSDLKVDDTKKKINTVSQHMSNDFLFLVYLAEENNYDFFVLGKTLYFRKPFSDKTPVVTLEWGNSLLAFSVDMNLSNQVSQVVVRGWDNLKNEVIEGKSSSITKIGSNSKTGKDIMKNLNKNTVEYIYTNVADVQEAKDRAEALHNKTALRLIEGSGEVAGLPEIQAGRYIKIANVGKKLSQPYYVTAVTHSINTSGYKTSFTVGGNAI